MAAMVSASLLSFEYFQYSLKLCGASYGCNGGNGPAKAIGSVNKFAARLHGAFFVARCVTYVYRVFKLPALSEKADIVGFAKAGVSFALEVQKILSVAAVMQEAFYVAFLAVADNENRFDHL